MARHARHRDAEVALAEALVASAKTIQQLRQGLAILLPAVAGLSIATTARVLGIGRNQVCVLRRLFREAGGTTFSDRDRRGGRHRELMSLDDEKAFVAGWRAEVPAASRAAVAEMQAAYEAAVGKPVARSTVYRLLQRHGLGAKGRAQGNGDAAAAGAQRGGFVAQGAGRGDAEV